MTHFIPYSRQLIDEDDIRAVLDVLRSDYLTQGPKVQEFESALAEYCGSRYAVVFSSGTAALHAAYFSSGIGSGDEIITSPITFAATANAALYLGAEPVFVDIEPETGNINPALIEKAVSSHTKAIVPVHYAGHPADIDQILELAEKHRLIVIEDACHALGASYKNRKIGSISDMTVFSFHPVKPITTGEGGAVLTDNQDYYEKLLMFRTHGIIKDGQRFANESDGNWYYEMQFLGYNYRMTDIQAALGISQLRKLDSFIDARRKIASQYAKVFSGNPYFDLPAEKGYAKSSWHLYPIMLKKDFIYRKPELFSKLRQQGLALQVHYIPVYMHPYYRDIGFKQCICPEAELFYKRQISIPLYHGMNDKDIRRVVERLNYACKNR
jgi:UDP-4-amino-4,6-dideoxy-L-N-acetyl-beta-L-altrosamine transaminase